MGRYNDRHTEKMVRHRNLLNMNLHNNNQLEIAQRRQLMWKLVGRQYDRHTKIICRRKNRLKMIEKITENYSQQSTKRKRTISNFVADYIDLRTMNSIDNRPNEGQVSNRKHVIREKKRSQKARNEKTLTLKR